ncbi:MAG: high-potential iron-sulfur protein [Gammaproteobacteria bacterium]
MKSDKQITRRTLLQTAVVVTPVALTGCTSLSRDDKSMPLVKNSDPVALAMAYYSNTRDVEADNPLATTHDVSQKCANCIHQQGSAGPGRIECPTFPGRNVSEEGWCSLWAQG